MKIKPILFNTEMVRAILDGRKTVTRRVVKPQPRGNAALLSDNLLPETVEQGAGAVYAFEDGTVTTPPYHPGDILYVRERWRVGAWSGPGFPLMAFDYADGTCGPMMDITDRDMFLRLVDQSREDARKANCKFDGIDYVWDKGRAPTRWRPSIHMPKEAARIWLEVTEVRAERLNNMTVGNAIREGIKTDGIITNQGPIEYRVWNEMQELWDSTIDKKDLDKYGWDANPWVWVIEFGQCEKPEEDT